MEKMAHSGVMSCHSAGTLKRSLQLCGRL